MGAAEVRVLRAGDGEVLGPPDGVRDRFVLATADSDGRFSLVEHLVPPRTLIAPLHRHSREDEFSLVLEGRVGAVSDGTEVLAGTGDLLWKPRGQWHTFWNADDEPARILEIISPGGLEELFRAIDAFAPEFPDPQTLGPMAERYGIDLDLEGTALIAESHGLSF